MNQEQRERGEQASGRAYQDVTGRRFGRLTALYPLAQRSKKRYVVWHCRCDCGNEADYAYNTLMYSGLKSCGCLRREHADRLPGYLARVDGTQLDRICSDKRPASNTSGMKGVYFIRGRYVAKLVFQKKQYYLGTYDTIEEAANARRTAQEAIGQTVMVSYEKWKAQARKDPDWAQENPVKIFVQKNESGGLELRFLPEME